MTSLNEIFTKTPFFPLSVNNCSGREDFIKYGNAEWFGNGAPQLPQDFEEITIMSYEG